MTGKFNLDSDSIGKLLDDPEARAVLDEVAPQIAVHPMINFVKAMPVNQLLNAAGGEVSVDVVETLRTRLAAL